jgi:hypothetical protein
MAITTLRAHTPSLGAALLFGHIGGGAASILSGAVFLAAMFVY